MRDGRAPDGHDRVADELLDGPAVAADDLPRIVEVAREQLARLFWVAGLRERREADQIGEQDRDKPSLGLAATGGARAAGTGSPSRAPHSPQNFASGLFAVPQAAQASASLAPHSPQNFRPGSLAVPHSGHVICGE